MKEEARFNRLVACRFTPEGERELRLAALAENATVSAFLRRAVHDRVERVVRSKCQEGAGAP